MPEEEVNLECHSLYAAAHGRVQGVYYRNFVQETARKLDLRGYVRNLPSGEDVEIIAEGKKENLVKLIEHLQKGPRLAIVEKVDISWTKTEERFQDFVIKY